VLAVSWISALPAYVGAVHGRTADDTPVGSVALAAALFVVAASLVAVVSVDPRSMRFTKTRDNVTVSEWTQEISWKSRRSNN
jgi:hypothetical protein